MTTPDPLEQHDAANVLAALSGQERDASGPAILAGHPATQVHPALAPRPNKPVIIKRRVSAFSGSDLDVLPRGADVDSLIRGGLATSGVVPSALRASIRPRLQAGRPGRRVHRPRPEDYRILTENIFPHEALVTTTYEGDLP
jgi:nicotinamidase-related amidase